MEIEELLSARYEVIVDYPKSLYSIGHIIYESENLEGKTFFKTEVQKYPHIFRKLDWNENREVSEMPKYVKFVWNNKINHCYKVCEWLYHDENEKAGNINGFTFYPEENSYSFPRQSLLGWLPATEKEYKEINKIK